MNPKQKHAESQKIGVIHSLIHVCLFEFATPFAAARWLSRSGREGYNSCENFFPVLINICTCILSVFGYIPCKI